MPKAFLKTKNRGGHHTYKCSFPGCPSPEIAPGDQYYTWKFNRGGRFFQHATHGHPRRSQLSQSKMAAVWDAVDLFDPSAAESVDDLQAMLQEVANAATQVAGEYADAADTIKESFPSGNPTSEACEGTSSELEDWASQLESWQPDAEYDPEEYDEEEDWLEVQREAAQDLVNEQPEYQG